MKSLYQRVTIRDVAKLAGVSITTVSHALNKTRSVDPNTQEKVFAAVKELRYTPNIVAQSLKGKGTKTIGIIISDIRESFFSDIVKSIEDRASIRGYNIILCDSEDDSEDENNYLNLLFQKGVDGIIFAPVNRHRQFPELEYLNIPFVQIDRRIDGISNDFVGIENAISSETATNILINNGAKMIGFVGYDEQVYTMSERCKGYKNAVDSIQNKQFIKRINYREETVDDIAEWIGDNQLDGIICANENLSYFTYQAIVKLGKKIPDEIKIIGFDDTKWLNLLSSPLTVIRQPTEKIGAKALEIIIDRITNQTDSEKNNILLPVEIIIRKSCGSNHESIIQVKGEN